MRRAKSKTVFRFENAWMIISMVANIHQLLVPDFQCRQVRVPAAICTQCQRQVLACQHYQVPLPACHCGQAGDNAHVPTAASLEHACRHATSTSMHAGNLRRALSLLKKIEKIELRLQSSTRLVRLYNCNSVPPGTPGCWPAGAVQLPARALAPGCPSGYRVAILKIESRDSPKQETMWKKLFVARAPF